MTPHGLGPGSVLVHEGRIAWLGTDAAADALTLSQARITHLHGALVTPGFVDSHVHATSTGLTLLGLDLSTVTSARALLDAVANQSHEYPHSLIIGHGWDESVWADITLPTADELESAGEGSHVYLTRVDAHSALVSRSLLTEIDELRDMRGFAESGWITEEAHHAVRERALGSLDEGTRSRAQDSFLDRAAQCGIVSVHEMAGPVISSASDCAQLLARARELNGVRVLAYWGELAQLGGLEAARAIGAIGTGGDLFVDGSFGSHTACLHDPYSDLPDSRGREFIDVESLISHVDACVRAGEQTGFHAIGDAATEAVIGAFAQAAEKHGVEAVKQRRHRIEHAESLTPESIRQCSRLGLIASMQPVFDERWGGREGMYAARLGIERARLLNPIADLHAAGVSVAFGSDTPVTPLDPWAAIRAAMNHQTPSQRIGFHDAVRSQSRAGWHAAHVDSAGDIEVGAAAHLAIWAPSGELPEPGALALRTIIDGKTCWDSGQLEDVSC